MRANRAARWKRDEQAGPEVIGALILFGLFVTTIAMLNITAVPAAGLAAEEEHIRTVLDNLNGLQLAGENGATPSNVGATGGVALSLAPARDVGQDFFSFFLAQPAQATGELTFERDYGNLSLYHYQGGGGGLITYDIGAASTGVTVGRITFDPNPVFRDEGIFQLENGGIVSTESGASSMRFAPPVTVTVDSLGITHVAIKARIFNGTDLSIGGSTSVRVALLTEAATLYAPTSENANSTFLRLETAHGPAWASYFNTTSQTAGLSAWDGLGTELGYTTSVAMGAGADGADVVTWRVYGIDSSATTRDIRLTSGIAVFGVSVG